MDCRSFTPWTAQGSYIPDRDQRELRELVRYRRSLIEERTREVNRLQKVLEGANIKLASVASNIMGVSGRAMIDAIIQDVNDPVMLAALAKGRLKSKQKALEKALNGLIGSHQKMILSTQLEHIDFLDQRIGDLDREVVNRTLPFEEDLELLDTIPGIGRRSAEEIIAEIGTDMNRFPSDAHLSSWARMSPGQNESAGKRKSSRTRKENNALRRTLTEAARAAARTKNTYLSVKYHRIAARRGANRAAVAVGHTILVIVYNMIKTREKYKDLGVDFLDRRKKNYTIRRSLKTLENLGIEVTVKNPEALNLQIEN